MSVTQTALLSRLDLVFTCSDSEVGSVARGEGGVISLSIPAQVQGAEVGIRRERGRGHERSAEDKGHLGGTWRR
jgi:hypothetical protein